MGRMTPFLKGSCDEGEACATRLDFATHTPAILLTQQHHSPFKRKVCPNSPCSFYSRKTWHKKKEAQSCKDPCTASSPYTAKPDQKPQELTHKQQNELHPDINPTADIHVQAAIDDTFLAHNQLQDVESPWKVATDLGVTCWTLQTGYV